MWANGSVAIRGSLPDCGGRGGESARQRTPFPVARSFKPTAVLHRLGYGARLGRVAHGEALWRS